MERRRIEVKRGGKRGERRRGERRERREDERKEKGEIGKRQ